MFKEFRLPKWKLFNRIIELQSIFVIEFSSHRVKRPLLRKKKIGKRHSITSIINEHILQTYAHA